MNLKTVGSKQISLHQLVDMNEFDRIKTCALKIGHSYQLNRVQVQSFRGRQYLSFPPIGASVHIIEDIGEVMEDSLLEDDSPSNEFVKAVSCQPTAERIHMYTLQKRYNRGHW